MKTTQDSKKAAAGEFNSIQLQRTCKTHTHTHDFMTPFTFRGNGFNSGWFSGLPTSVAAHAFNVICHVPCSLQKYINEHVFILYLNMGSIVLK
jgi:hypothetical protein